MPRISLASNPPQPFRLLNRREVADMLGLSVPTIDKLTASGKIPIPIKIGRSVKWRPDQITDFINKKVENAGTVPAGQTQAPAPAAEARDGQHIYNDAVGAPLGQKDLDQPGQPQAESANQEGETHETQ